MLSWVLSRFWLLSRMLRHSVFLTCWYCWSILLICFQFCMITKEELLFFKLKVRCNNVSKYITLWMIFQCYYLQLETEIINSLSPFPPPPPFTPFCLSIPSPFTPFAFHPTPLPPPHSPKFSYPFPCQFTTLHNVDLNLVCKEIVIMVF